MPPRAGAKRGGPAFAGPPALWRKQVDVGLPATWAWFEQHRCAVDRCGEEPGGRSALRAFLCHDVGALCPGLLRAFPHLRYVVVVPCFDKGQRGRLPPPHWPNFSPPLTPFEGLAQDLVHHHPAPAPAQEEPLLGSAEKPAPGPDRGSRRSRFSRSPANPFHRRGPPGCNGCAPAPRPLPVRPAGQPRIEYGAGSDGPPGRWPQRSVSTDGTFMEHSQIPLDGPYRQPPLFPQGHDQAHQIGSEALPTHGQTFQRVLGQPPFPAQRTGPGYEYVLRDFRRDYRNVYDLPGPLGPSPGESGMAFGTRLRGVDHPPGGFHPRPGEAVLTLLSRLLFFRCPVSGKGQAVGVVPVSVVAVSVLRGRFGPPQDQRRPAPAGSTWLRSLSRPQHASPTPGPGCRTRRGRRTPPPRPRAPGRRCEWCRRQAYFRSQAHRRPAPPRRCARPSSRRRPAPRRWRCPPRAAGPAGTCRRLGVR